MNYSVKIYYILYLLENTQYISILLFVNKLLFDTEIVLSLVQVGPAGSTTNIFGPVLFCGFLNQKNFFFWRQIFIGHFILLPVNGFPWRNVPTYTYFSNSTEMCLFRLSLSQTLTIFNNSGNSHLKSCFSIFVVGSIYRSI